MKTIKDFFQSDVCRSRTNCTLCRTSVQWREAFAAAFKMSNPNFDCPFKVTPEKAEALVATTEEAKCKHFQNLIKFKDRICCGGRVKKISIYRCAVIGEITVDKCYLCKSFQKA
jgi:hypothetical protein